MSIRPAQWLTRAAVWVLAGCAVPLLAQEEGTARALFVNGIRNEGRGFMVRVSVDREDRTYREGQPVKFEVRSEKDGYLYLLNARVDGKVLCIFPNQFQPNNAIKANVAVKVPADGANFTIDVDAPFSNGSHEVVKAIVTREPIREVDLTKLIAGFAEEVPEEVYKALIPRALAARPAVAWGEHDIEIRTLAANFKDDAKRSRRIAVVIGIQDYLDTKIRDLKVCAADAKRFAAALRQSCQFDETVVLTDADATYANLENLLRHELPRKTRPGDTVVIFWSGHGGRCADDNGDETDGFDEFLVVHDGKYDNIESIRSSMLMDDTMGRWIQELDGRRVALVLDTCHSGGQAKAVKSLENIERFGKGLVSPEGIGTATDILDGELARAKDIGQKHAAVLASSTANQISFERREGDLSVMTYYLVDLLTSATETVTLKSAYEYAKENVPVYVEKQFPGTTQTPILSPVDQGDLVLRP